HIDFKWKDIGFFILAFNRLTNHRTIKEELELNDQFINDLNHFFQSRKWNALIGQKSGHVIVLLTEEKKEEIGASLHQFCAKKYRDYRINIGVSSTSESIDDASNLYEETLACLKIASQNQHIVYFDSLGIVGILFQTRNQDGLHRF
ncbi:hypothetical protein MAY24_24555, partial [Escherichia coli]